MATFFASSTTSVFGAGDGLGFSTFLARTGSGAPAFLSSDSTLTGSAFTIGDGLGLTSAAGAVILTYASLTSTELLEVSFNAGGAVGLTVSFNAGADAFDEAFNTGSAVAFAEAVALVVAFAEAVALAVAFAVAFKTGSTVSFTGLCTTAVAGL